jgi:hypothetical protein
MYCSFVAMLLVCVWFYFCLGWKSLLLKRMKWRIFPVQSFFLVNVRSPLACLPAPRAGPRFCLPPRRTAPHAQSLRNRKTPLDALLSSPPLRITPQPRHRRNSSLRSTPPHDPHAASPSQSPCRSHCSPPPAATSKPPTLNRCHHPFRRPPTLNAATVIVVVPGRRRHTSS